jgi:hydrogenase-4 component B
VTLSIALAGAAILLLALSGTLAIVLHARGGLGQLAGQIGAVSGSICGLVAALRVLVTGNAVSLSGIWHMPGGGLHFEIDVLSAFFLLPVFGLSIVTGLYGRSYLAGHGGIASAASWFHLNMLTASMALVIAAQDGLLFLLAWEIMALSPFFLVIFDDRKAAVRYAAWTRCLASRRLGSAPRRLSDSCGIRPADDRAGLGRGAKSWSSVRR